MISAIIQVVRAVKARESEWALAAVVGLVVDTAASVLTGVVSFCAKGYFLLTVFSHESRGTLASVGLDQVHAGRVVRAFVAHAVVDVGLTPESLVTGGAVATVTH